MKKIIIIIFICIFTLVGCKTTTYTTQFPFLPSLPNMEFGEIVYQSEENEYITATYTVKNSTQEQVIDEYIKILENNSWDVTFVNKPIYLEAAKDNNKVIIFINQNDNDVALAIVAK